MCPEAEAHALLAAKHLRCMLTGRPSAFPRPLQQFSACSRQEAALIDIRQRGQHCKAVCISENVAGRNDEDTSLFFFIF